MDIALASDNNYVQHLAVTIESIIDNNQNEYIVFHIMNNGITKNNMEKLRKQIEDKNKEVYFYDFTNLEEEVGFKSHSSVLPISTYSRIFLPPRLKKQTSRLIYMDVDMVCKGSLAEVYSIDMKNNIIAAVQDFAGVRARVENGLDLNYRYVNCGFMLIDIDEWMKYDVTSKVHNYILERQGKVVQEDQGAINSVLRDKIMLLHPKYNAMTPFFFCSSAEIKGRFSIPVYYTDKEMREARRNPIVIHYLKYNGFVNRPWEEHSVHPLKKEYINYLNKTEWSGCELISDKRSLVQRIKCDYQIYMPWVIKKFVMKKIR